MAELVEEKKRILGEAASVGGDVLGSTRHRAINHGDSISEGALVAQLVGVESGLVELYEE